MVKLSTQSAFLSLLFSFAIICNVGICKSKASCHKKDKQILLCFKQGLTDPSGMLSSWSSKQDCCEWMGVQCDIIGRVANLSLPCSTDDSIYGINKNKSHCLTGEFHLSLLELEFLKYLDLSNNNFKSIHLGLDCQNLSLVNPPHVSGNSSNLAYFDLSNNEILVIVDLRWILRLSSLEYLNLDFINLHKQTQWLQMLTKLPSLTELHLASCQLESASPSLDYANFTSLKYLDLSDNGFISKLPIWLFNISGLSVLLLNENHFHGQIPDTLLNLENLYYLRLMDNRLSGTIPDWLGQLGSLQYLDLSYNFFTGPIPTTLGNLSSLIRFDVDSNHLTGSLPESFGQLSNLELLGVGENYLSGTMSDRNFAKLSKLQRLWLGSPFLIFDFDPRWIPPFQLQILALDYVDLKLLPWLYTQTFLERLSIGGSSFTHESQDKFWNWTAHLSFLSLYNNSMHWDMSNVLLNPEVIWLVGNGLSGGLPQLTSNVRVFIIANNSLSGPLSPLLCHEMNRESNLHFLDISSNFVSGGLTECWENWKSLIHIGVGKNNLTGTIPHSMGELSNLSSLNLNKNNLHGKIPQSLKKCQKLMFLNLAFNKFSGSIPNWIGQNMKALVLRSNEFHNDIPLQICQLSSLIVLDVANNRLSGPIPHCLNNITAMVFNNALIGETFGINDDDHTFVFSLPLLIKGNELYYSMYMNAIDLSNNHLSGKIPSKIFTLTALQSLNLSQNQLWGTIPEEIGNMKQLESIDFSNNKLSGEIPQSMSALSFLGFLNLSFNNFKGKIPLGTQLQTFTALSFIGNPELCGTPLIKNCTQGETPNNTKLMGEEEKGSEVMEWFYMGMGIGFAISFWLVCGSLFCIRAWRHAYFKFLDDMKDQLYVKMVLKCTPSIEI